MGKRGSNVIKLDQFRRARAANDEQSASPVGQLPVLMFPVPNRTLTQEQRLVIEGRLSHFSPNSVLLIQIAKLEDGLSKDELSLLFAFTAATIGCDAKELESYYRQIKKG